jgi:hypothetical protein
MFGIDKKNKKTGRKARCKECYTKIQREKREREKEKAEDPEKYHKKWADYYAKTKEHNYSIKKKFLENPENRSKRNLYIREYKKKRKNNDKSFVLYENLRKRIWKSVSKKNDKSINLLGCDIKFYLKWIEFTMDKEMSWENYGTIWNIDHLIGISNFNLMDSGECKKAFNWKNTWAMNCSENFSKNNKIIKKQIDKHSKLLDTFLNNNKLEISSQAS